MHFIPKQLLTEFKAQCDWVSMRLVRETSRQLSTRDARPLGPSTHDDHGLMLEVVVDGTLTYGATSDLSEAGLRACFQNSLQRARALKKLKLMNFDPSTRGQSVEKIHRLGQQRLQDFPLGELLERQMLLGQKLKAGANVLSSSVSDVLITTHTHYLTSDGGDIDQMTSIVARDMRATGKKGSVIQSRSRNGYMAQAHQQGAEVFAQMEQDNQAVDKILRELNELLDAPDCPTGELDVMIAPDQMMLQIHESIGHPLELDRILGDERNYAGWSFVKPEDFGTLKYGSDLMNVCFDPHLPGEIASYAHDDSGLMAEKVYLIKNGQLLAGLGASESQKRLNLQGVANFRAQSWNRPPIDRMANLNLEPGPSSREQMISSIERGIYMETNRSWSIDDYRNKFQFGCEYAREIIDGKLGKVVKNPNYRGVTVAFWNSLKAVGDASTFEVYGTPHCGKGEPNQVIRVGHASPACVFSKLSVFGGA
jgi:predicted Zn-dependent protease